MPRWRRCVWERGRGQVRRLQGPRGPPRCRQDAPTVPGPQSRGPAGLSRQGVEQTVGGESHSRGGTGVLPGAVAGQDVRREDRQGPAGVQSEQEGPPKGLGKEAQALTRTWRGQERQVDWVSDASHPDPALQGPREGSAPSPGRRREQGLWGAGGPSDPRGMGVPTLHPLGDPHT